MSEQLHRDWMQRAKYGDEHAFTCLVKAYQDKVYSMAFYMTKNKQDAEDMTQEVFLKLWRTLGTYRGEASPQVWILQIAKHTCYDYLKARKRRETEPLYYENDGQEVERPLADDCEQNDPVKAVEQDERRQNVTNALMQLPPEHREVLVWRYVQGLSYEQMARLAGQSQGTVKSRVFRAKKILKNILKNSNFF